MTVGIPRGMSFYHNYPFYYGFFTDLGIKIVLSDVTTKQTMSNGSALVVTETCLPIKIYIGHVLNLIEKGAFSVEEAARYADMSVKALKKEAKRLGASL